MYAMRARTRARVGDLHAFAVEFDRPDGGRGPSAQDRLKVGLAIAVDAGHTEDFTGCDLKMRVDESTVGQAAHRQPGNGRWVCDERIGFRPAVVFPGGGRSDHRGGEAFTGLR